MPVLQCALLEMTQLDSVAVSGQSCLTHLQNDSKGISPMYELLFFEPVQHGLHEVGCDGIPLFNIA